MTVWVVKGGRVGERETRILDKSVLGIGWEEMPDLSKIATRQEMEDLYGRTYPDAKRERKSNHVGQLWAFRQTMQVGDLAVVPLKTQSAIAVGKVSSDYEYRTDLGGDMVHTRGVRWKKTDFPRSAFDQDLLYSFGAFMAVCQVTRNNAEERIRAVVEGKKAHETGLEASDTQAEITGLSDIEQGAKDQVLKHLSQRFRGHELARLVEALLMAQGMKTKASAPGPDGGVDILAASGPLGLDTPRLCVQVKSSDSPVDVTVFRGLVGTMQAYGAEQGLLVAWGGFKKTVRQEAATAFFRVRLWDASDLLNALFEYYERLPATIRAELPLKRIWALAMEEA
jgi:restriction system protein